MATQQQPPGRPRLSVAMIVRDEEDVLTATLESVRAVADEILVLDTGSTDQTPTVAAQMGAMVTRTTWSDDFSAARNRLLEQVTGDWILWVDAGEWLEAGSAAELRRFVDQKADRQKVYSLFVEVPPADPSASSEQAARPRLMPNHPGLRFTGRVRETLQPSMEANGFQIELGPGRIVRHPRQHDPERKALKARRNLELVALERAAGDDMPPRLLVAMGEACSDLNQQAAARQAFLQAIRTARRGSIEMLEGYYGLLTTFDGDPSQAGRQLELCLAALEIYPLDAQLLSAMGSYLQAQNRLDLAARAFETAVKHGQIAPETWHLREITEMAAACLNLTLQIQAKDDEARRVLEETLDRYPASFRIRRHLVNLHVKHGREEEAFRVADAMPGDPQHREPWRNAIRGATKAIQKDWTPALGYLQSAYAAGCCDPFCLRWLSVTLLSNGQIEAAEPILHQWLQLEPANREARMYLNAVQEQGRPKDAAAEQNRSRQIRIDPASTAPGAISTQMPDMSSTPSAEIERG